MQDDFERETFKPTSRPGTKVILAIIFVLSAVIFLGRGQYYDGQYVDGKYIDLIAHYGSTRCILAGCNPYSLCDVTAQLLSHGVDAADISPGYWPHHAFIYPPLTYYALTPLALFDFPAAGLLYFWLSGLAMIFACVLTIFFSPPPARTFIILATSAVLMTASLLLRLGQPSTIVIALLIAGAMLFLSRRHLLLAAVLLLLGAAIKPQLVLPILAYFCLPRDTRKYALSTFAAFVLASLLACAAFWHQPATANWVADLKVQLNIAVLSGPDALVDPGIVDLKALVSLISGNPLFYQAVDVTIFAAFLVIFGLGYFRNESNWERDWICVAALTFFTLTLTYHRNYDLRLQILSFPALGMLFRRSIKLAVVITVLNGLLLISTPFFLLILLVHYFGGSIEQNLFVRIFVERQQAVILILMAFLWAAANLCVNWQTTGKQAPHTMKS